MYISHIKLQHTDGDVLMRVYKMRWPREVGIVKLWWWGHRSVSPGTSGCPRCDLGRMGVESRPPTAALHRLPDGRLADAHTPYDDPI